MTKSRSIAATLTSLSLGLWLGCGVNAAPNPFSATSTGGGGSGGAGGSAGEGGVFVGAGGGSGGDDAGPPVDPTLGGPCVDDGQCNDGFACTLDKCDLTLSRCRFSPDDQACQNSAYCDGVEKCSNKLGCIAGDPVGCDDDTACTIDVCDEKTHGCLHAPRDADFDGDPDIHCPGGGDCDDTDPTVSSKQPEICGNVKDDNCNAVAEEQPCVFAMHDTCLDPLEIAASGSYALDTTGSAFNYATTCGLGNQPGSADVVAALLLPAGPPVDVEITARTIGYPVSVSIAGQCGDPATEIACAGSYAAPMGGLLSKLLARSLGGPGQPTVFPIYVATAPPAAVALDVQILPVAPIPTNETCGTAQPVVLNIPFTAPIFDAKPDIASACATQLGELVYSVTLADTSDIDVFASSADGDGNPAITLRGPGCALLSDELTCQIAQAPHLFRHSLPAGTYYVSVSATAPTNVLVTVELSAPTPLPPDESCVASPLLAHNKTIDVPLSGHQDDVNLGCFTSAVDAAYELDLSEPSDVLLVERIAQADLGAVELSDATCATPASLLACGSGAPSPVRAHKHAVPAGQYRVVVESFLGEDVQVTAFVRPAAVPLLVPFADTCADAFTIPPQGGLFQGTTANANADYNAGCDQGGVPPGTANDQLLKLVLPAAKRVIFDMSGSGYTTILDVRKGPNCPGDEMPASCAVGYYQDRSYLDLKLAAGTYYVQIDGFNLDKGPWFLDVRVVDP
ncbi:MAG: putative metal-binding motif-containing protein [Minicystis sp.]